MTKRVIAAMSGGVDSSVAALLAKKEGYEVIGITMCLGVKENGGDRPLCCGISAIEDARKVCSKIGIPHYVFDYSRELEEKVIKNFISEYLKGRTPNPCIDCNRYIKFDAFFSKARSVDADFIATGHYALIEQENDKYILKKPKDKEKDQTYFIYPIKREYLKNIIFPLGKFTKEEVRKIARENHLPVADKKESQDICFIPNRDYKAFILQRTSEIREGDIADKGGNVIGRHKGLCFYTIGQREGLGITSKRPLYVIKIDSKNNRIIVGEKADVMSDTLTVIDLNLFADTLPPKATARIRYRKKEAVCSIFQERNKTRVVFKEKQEAVTPGQSIVFYDGDIVLGGGVIE